MTATALGRLVCGAVLAAAVSSPTQAAELDKVELARKAQEVLRANCYRCHGQNGNIEGGMNFILDLDKLAARHKVIPGKAEESPLYKRVAAGKMPPPGETPRPSPADVALLKQWVDAGAPGMGPAGAQRALLTDAEVFTRILADLETLDRRSRRFVRYFTLTDLYNAGLGDDELQTYRNALAKLVNSLSWHPRLTLPKPIDPERTVLRIDLRDYLWDANLWNRILQDYPYGVLYDTATARAAMVASGTRMPFVRANWFVANASRPALYVDILQLPATLPELERQLRVDAAVDIQQERVARAGFNGSGIARNNRLLERHDAIHGAYWRSYDFDAIPQNLVDRDNLLPDRRNLFAHPLGPGFTEASFQHFAGEAIFNLPNGLQGYYVMDAIGRRLDKANTAIVTDPKRPDKAVETGISCMGCHYAGLNFKDDQIRDFVQKNAKAFSRSDAELIQSLYPPREKMRALMDEDAERFRHAVEKCGVKVSAAEPTITLTLRYEDDVDLATAASEASLRPEEFVKRLAASELLMRNLGALKVPGGTVQRPLWVQGFGDVVREMHLGTLLQPTLSGQTLPDNTGEIDPLEAQSGAANSMAFSADGKLALVASADKSVRLWDVEAGRDLRRFIGHTASVWSVAFSPDGKQALSGGADNSVRLWDVETGREVQRLAGHSALVTCVAFSPDGRRALSASYDQTVIYWDLETGRALRTLDGLGRYLNAVAFAPDGHQALVGAERSIRLLDLDSGKETGRLEGHVDAVVCAVFSADGKQVASASDDGTVRLWDVVGQRERKIYSGHTGPVKSVVFAADGLHLLSGGADDTVRLWDTASGQELKRFTKHAESILGVAFVGDGTQTLSGSRDSLVKVWDLSKILRPANVAPKPAPEPVPEVVARGDLRPAATIPVGAALSGLTMSPNGKWLYYLNAAENRLERIDTEHKQRAGDVKLAEGTEAFCLTRDGKTLYAVARSRKGDLKAKAEGKIQVIDPKKMEVVRTLQVAVDPYDVAAADNGRVYVSGGSGDWTDVTVVDGKDGTVLARWGGVWVRSFLQLAPAQDRLYVATQGVSPGTVTTVILPAKYEEKATTHASAAGSDHALGGEFIVSPDGRYLLCKTGTVLSLAPERPQDLQFHATVTPFLAAALDTEHHVALLLTTDGTLERYSYPEFKLQGTYRLGVVGYQAALDPKQGRLFVAGIDPRALAGRPTGKNLGDIYVYDVQALLQEKK